MNIVRLDNPKKDYAWGSRCSLQTLIGEAPDGQPLAEIWMGAHPASPSRLPDGRPLSEVDVRERGNLSFLFKFLSAEQALSIQAHPSREQAEEGFAREEEAGIPMNARERTFRDRNHKPEIIVALEPFQGMSGFRPLEDALASLMAAGVLSPEAAGRDQSAAGGNPGAGAGDESAAGGQPGSAATDESSAGSDPGAVDESAAGGEVSPVRSLSELLAAVISLPRSHVESVVSRPPFSEAGAPPEHCPGPVTEDTRNAWVAELYRQYGADGSVFAPLFLNLVYLEPGEGLFQSPGVLHAYLRGTGVELMAESDNVVRAGLTGKHVDARMLHRIVSFTSEPPRRVLPQPADGDAETIRLLEGRPQLLVYDTPVADFRLYRVDFQEAGDAGSASQAGAEDLEPGRASEIAGEFECGTAPCIIACVSGEVTVAGRQTESEEESGGSDRAQDKREPENPGGAPDGYKRRPEDMGAGAPGQDSENDPSPIHLTPGQSAFVPASVSRFQLSGSGGSAFIATAGRSEQTSSVAGNSAQSRVQTSGSPGAVQSRGQTSGPPGRSQPRGQRSGKPGPSQA